VPGWIGPLLTTGVALSVAAVVVANPVIPPRADLQIPAVKLSGTGDAMDMLDNDFLSAIGPAQTESSTNPFAVLKDLISSLAADATYLTKSAIVSAFFAGATAVTDPKLTAASYPLIPPSALTGGPVGWPSPVAPTAAAEPVTAEQLLAVAVLPADLVPAAAELVTALMDDVHGLTDGAVVTAAFAAGAQLAAEGGQVLETLRGLVDHGVEAALTDVIAAVGSGDAQNAIISGIRRVIEPPLPATPSAVTPSTESPTASTPVDGQWSIGSGPPASPVPSDEPVGAERVQLRKSASDPAVVLPRPDAGLTDAGVSLPGVLQDGIDTAAHPRFPARPGPVNDAFTDARNQAHGILRNAADAVRKAADHAAKAVSAPTGD